MMSLFLAAASAISSFVMRVRRFLGLLPN